MNADWVNPFLVPLKNVWSEEFGLRLVTVKLSYSSEKVTSDEVTVVVAVQGAIKGQILYEMDIKTACAIASAKLKQPVKTMNISALTTIGDIVGGVSRHAVSQLSRDGYLIQVGAPTIYQAEGTKVITERIRQIVVIFGSALGNLSVRVWLEERKSSGTEVGWLMSQSGLARR